MLWVGDAALVQRYMARRAPHVTIVEHEMLGALDWLRRLRLEEGDAPDVMVLDITLPSVNPLQLLNTVSDRGMDVPVVLLTQPGQDNLIAHVDRMAVCDCLVKTQDFVHQVLASFSQVRARHGLLTELRKTQQNEERVKAILEMQPAPLCVIGNGGEVLAMNRAGLDLLHQPLSGVVGQEFAALAREEERAEVSGLLQRARANAPGVLEHALVLPDGTHRKVQTRAVAMARGPSTVALVTFQEMAAPPHAEFEGVAAERDALLAERAALVAERERLAAERHALTIERDTLRAEQLDLIAGRDELIRQRDAIAERQDALRQSYAEMQAVHNTLIAQLAEERDQRALDLQAAEARFADSSREIAADRARLEAALEGAEADRNQLRADHQALRARCDEIAADRSRLEDERRRVEGLLQQASQAAAAARQEREEAQQAHEEERARLVQERDSVVIRCDALTAERALWEATMRTELETSVGALQDEQARLKEALDAAQAEADQSTASLRDMESRLRSSEEALRKSEDTLREREDALRAAEEARRTTEDALRAADEARRAADEARRASDDAWTQQRDEARARQESLAAQIAELQAQADAARGRVADTAAERDAAANERDQACQELKAVRQELGGLRAAHETERTAWQAGQTARDDMAAALRTEQLRNEVIARELAQVRSEAAAATMAEARSQHLVEELTTLRVAYRRAESERQILQVEAKTARQRFEELAKGLVGDQQELQKLRQTLIECLCDADSSCKTLTARRATTLHDFDVWADSVRRSALGALPETEPSVSTAALGPDPASPDERFSG